MEHLLAWEYLRRNPEYENEVANLQKKPPVEGPAFLDSYIEQQPHDDEARKWGLLSYNEIGNIPPFWFISTTLSARAVANDDPPFLETLKQNKVFISGLRLLNGSLILKLQKEGKTVQLHFENDESLSPSTSITLDLPVNQTFTEKVVASQTLFSFYTPSLPKKNCPKTKQAS